MKDRKRLIAPALTLAALLAMGIGSTFALFTDTDSKDISVGAGKVDVSMTLTNLKTYSGVDLVGNSEDSVVQNSGTEFAAGGTASINADGDLVLTGMVPGDKVTFTYNYVNNSTVDTKWRTSFAATGDKELISALVIKDNGFPFQAGPVRKYSDWRSNNDSYHDEFTVSLPTDAGNDVMDKTIVISFRAEAVQSNAKTDNYFAAIGSSTDLANMAWEVNNGYKYGNARVIQTADIDLQGLSWDPIGTYDHPFMGRYDGQGHTIKNLSEDYVEGDYIGLFGYVKGSSALLPSTFSAAYYHDTVLDDSFEEAKFTAGIKNLKILDCEMTASASVYAAGVLAGWTEYAFIKNIVADGCKVLGQSCGILAGYADASYVADCSIDATEGTTDVRPSYEGGGAIGRIGGVNHSSGTFVDRVNSNVRLVTETGDCYLGGVVGRIYDCDWALIRGCRYTGTCENYAEQYVYGGIVGEARLTGAVLNCFYGGSFENVSYDYESFYCAGIVGYNTMDIQFCNVEANVEFYADYVAGIANFDTSNANCGSIVNCTVTGTVATLSPSGTAGRFGTGVETLTLYCLNFYEATELSAYISPMVEYVKTVDCQPSHPFTDFTFSPYLKSITCDNELIESAKIQNYMGHDLSVKIPNLTFDIECSWDGDIAVTGSANTVNVECDVMGLEVTDTASVVNVYACIHTLLIPEGVQVNLIGEYGSVDQTITI